VIGAGAWGTAVANILSNNKLNVKLYTHEEKVIDSINTKHINSVYLDEYTLSPTLVAKHITQYSMECDLLVNAVPTQYIRHYYTQHKIKTDSPLLNISKGIENSSLFLIHELFELILNITPNRFCVLTGPSHAEESVKKLPTTVVASSTNSELSSQVQNIFNNDFFRVYTSSDVAGAETGGALKNVIAVAAGISDGLKLGDNAKAALITRGLAEIRRLGIAKGADPHTFSGLSGLGDLFVTCNSKLSRNRKVGELIAQGLTLSEISEQYNFVAEGVATAISANELGKSNNVELPIINKVNEILFDNKNPQLAVKELMQRETKSEIDFIDS
jgi:glycerol-3-phosphate dehydrogenase (NAD(P)+)